MTSLRSALYKSLIWPPKIESWQVRPPLNSKDNSSSDYQALLRMQKLYLQNLLNNFTSKNGESTAQ